MELEPMYETAHKEIFTLISSSANSHDSNDAMRYAQAALNAANALAQLTNIKLPKGV